MAEVTLADLVALEPRLRLWSEARDTGDTEVGWVVAARTAPPMLPTLRGGELVFFGEGAIAAAGQPWPDLITDLHRLGAIGLIVPAGIAPDMPDSPLSVLTFHGDGSPGEIEGVLNRALTEFRGELYRTGTDLGRMLGKLGAVSADAVHLVREAATLLDLPVRFAAASETLAEHDPRSDRSISPAWERATIPGGFETAVGWTDRRRAALARIAAERLAEALAAAARRADADRPRGPARARGLNLLLFGEQPADDLAQRATALRLGLSPDAEYRVAIAPAASISEVQRYAGASAPIDAGSVDGDPAWLLETRKPQSPRSAATDRTGESFRPLRSGGDCWLAISAPAHGFSRLPEAAAEARFVGTLLRSGRIQPGAVAFDDARTLGAWQVLYPLRGGDALRAFSAAVLRELPDRDRRGELRRTLAVFLETGGASVEAARLLGIHRNTLAYRLRQVANLTGLDPLDPATRLSLQLALMALEIAGDSAGAS